MHAADAEGRRRADYARLHVEVEQLFTGIGGIGAEPARAGALEHQIARGGHRSAIPRCRVIDTPRHFARTRIKGDQSASGGSDGCPERRLIVGQHRAWKRCADVEAQHLALIQLVHVLQIPLRDLLRGDIDQPRSGVEAHRVPVVRAQRAGDGDERFAGLVEARLGVPPTSRGCKWV